MTNTKLIVLLFFASVISCKAQYDGVYIDQTKNLYKIELKNELFVYKWKSSNNVSSYCIDTLAYGTFEELKKLPLLKFSSYENQYASFLNMSVKEEKGESGVVKFNILNPIEKSHSTYNSGNDNARAIEYSLVIRSECSKFQTEVNQMVFNTNTIVIPNFDDCQIKSFEVIVHPRNYARDWSEENQPRLVYTLEYDVQSYGANTFKVEMDELTPCFLAAQRLHGDFILIHEDKSLEWNNILFVKE